MRKLLIMILFGLGAGCSIYKLDIQQGNTLEAKQVAALKPGMSREQVTYLLGSPLLQEPFSRDRWDYVFSYKPGGGELRSQHLTLYFDGNTLARIDRSQFDDYRKILTPTSDVTRETSNKAIGGGGGPAPPPRRPGGPTTPFP